MKIGRNTLGAGGISLIPAHRAYFGLRTIPAFHSPSRMNKLEAQQGLTAQKLQADLASNGSAVQESLNE